MHLEDRVARLENLMRAMEWALRSFDRELTGGLPVDPVERKRYLSKERARRYRERKKEKRP